MQSPPPPLQITFETVVVLGGSLYEAVCVCEKIYSVLVDIQKLDRIVARVFMLDGSVKALYVDR